MMNETVVNATVLFFSICMEEKDGQKFIGRTKKDDI